MIKASLGLLFLRLFICSSEYVIDLDQNNFYQTIEKYDNVLIDFYAGWCGHCKNFAPLYEEAAKNLYEMGSWTVLAKVDSVHNKKLRSDWNVHSYPTLLFFQNGHLVEKYTGKKDVDSVMRYVLANEI
jgi:protein disulfide-isomerase-like protein